MSERVHGWDLVAHRDLSVSLNGTVVGHLVKSDDSRAWRYIRPDTSGGGFAFHSRLHALEAIARDINAGKISA